jgi:mannose-6-phosphate isomerase-like protein (cupin superfamily)
MIIRGQSLEPIDFGGLNILDYTAETGFGISLASIDVPPGAKHPRCRSTRSDKYYLVTRGCVRFVVGDETTELAKGDFCFVEQGITFSYENVSSSPVSLVLVHLPPFELSAEVFVD